MLILIFLLILSVGVNIFAFFAIKRLFAKHDAFQAVVMRYDTFYMEVQNRITAVLNTMRAIDAHGSFQSDDEVGGVFEQLKALVNALDVFLDSAEDERNNEQSS